MLAFLSIHFLSMRALILIILFLITPLAFAKGVYLEPEEFIESTFNGSPPEAERVIVKGELSKEIKSILGERYRKIRIPFWREGNRTVWILERIGKELPITAGFVITDNKIENFKVLIFRESRGWEIRNDFFTRQFDGGKLIEKNKLNHRIDNITGATLSVNAMKKLSRMALYLHQHVISKQ